MKFKVSKILIGISALVVAGIMCVVPFSKVKAEQASCAIQVHTPTAPAYTIPGNAVFTFEGTGSAINVFNHFDLHQNPYNQYDIDAMSAFNGNLPASATCNVEFSFTFEGIAYYGNIGLTNYGTNFHPASPLALSQFVDTRDLYGVQAFGRAINEKVNEIDMAFNGHNADGTVNETKTVEYNYNYAINEKIIEKLAQADGVTLLYTFEYEGYVFTSAITSEDAAKIFSKDIPWYGPCYIASNCPTVMVGVAN